MVLAPCHVASSRCYIQIVLSFNHVFGVVNLKLVVKIFGCMRLSLFGVHVGSSRVMMEMNYYNYVFLMRLGELDKISIAIIFENLVVNIMVGNFAIDELGRRRSRRALVKMEENTIF